MANQTQQNSGQDGNILVYIIVVMMLFAVLGTALVSIYNTAGLSSAVSDDSRQAGYLAESAARYAMGELKKSYTHANIQTLNATTYTLNDGNSFDINVFGKWFEAAATTGDLSNGDTLTLDVPDNATLPDGFEIVDDTYLVNLDSLRDSIAFNGSPNSKFIAKVGSYTQIDTDTFTVVVQDDFQVNVDQPVHLAAYPDTTTYSSPPYNIAINGTANLVIGDTTAEDVFHEDGGTFYVLDPSTGEFRIYSYDSYTVNSPVTLNNIRGTESLSIDPTRDIIVFTEKNHTVHTQGTTGPSTSQAGQVAALDLPQNTSTAPSLPGPEYPHEKPADIQEGDMVSGSTSAPASNSNAVELDLTNKKIILGRDQSQAFSNVWCGGTKNVGGVMGFCGAGKCLFKFFNLSPAPVIGQCVLGKCNNLYFLSSGFSKNIGRNK